MKADMSRLMGTARKPDPYRNLAKKAAVFACCLAVMGAGMVFNALRAGDSASADSLFDPSLYNPSFTVQQEADVALPGIQAGKGAIPVLTRRGGGYSMTPDEEGLLKTKMQRVQLYEGYETDWLHTAALEQMSLVAADSAAYELKEVWVGKNPESVNQSDFLVARVDGFGKVTFTNNPADPGLSAAEGGYYVPSGDGTYMACIEEGSVVRLVFGEKDGWSYAGAKASDFDVTDGGYYLEDDYFHRSSKKETSKADKEKGNIYVDAIQSGINTESNYQGAGAKLAFGADLIGMDLAEQSLSGELDSLNIFNYEQSGATENTGVTLGLMSGIAADGSPEWVKGISVPGLFSGEAEGKTAYDTQFSLVLTDKGTSHTLSSVESEWGTAAEGLEKPGTGFWIMDVAPSFAADGHDIAWGTGNENLQFYLSGDRAPAVLPASPDGASHNKYFGLSWSVDFTLEPGYTGPLNVFAVSDDDLWVFAAKLDENGNVTSSVQGVDLGGVHDTAGAWCDLWDVIERVPASGEPENWRLYFFILERDGDGSELYVRYSVPEPAARAERTPGTVMVEASKYESGEGTIRTFVLEDGTCRRYKLTHDDGKEETITAGEPFQLASGSFASIDGMDEGAVFRVKETGRKNVWHSTGEGFEEGDTAECAVGRVHRISFLSAMDSGTLTIAAAGSGDPEGGYHFFILLEGMGGKEVSAMDGYNTPIGTQFADKDGVIEAVLSAGEALKLYGLPDDARFTVTPGDAPGWRLAEIMIDGADASGVQVTGTVPGYAVYRYEKEDDRAIEVSMEQSASGDWGREDIEVHQGSLISYRITVTNPNPSAVEATVEDALPDGLEILPGSVTDGAVDGQRITWDVAVDGESSVELAFTCRVTAGNPVRLTNMPVLIDGSGPRQVGNTVTAIVP